MQPYYVHHLSAPAQARICAAVIGAIGLAFLRGFFVFLRRDRVVGDTPLMRIRSAAQGYVKVAGRASPPAGQAPATAPLTSRPCVWWSYNIAHREADAKGNNSWRIVEHADSTELFLLTDEDGQCLVGPVQAEITPTTTDIWHGGESRPTGPPPPRGTVVMGADWRYTERLLSVNDHLSVMGDLRSHSEVADLNAATALKLKQWKQDQKSLLARFDTNHDGQIDASEWEAVRAAAAKECQAETLNTGVARISVISKPVHGEPFLIAPLSAEALEKRERRYSVICFCVSLVCVILCGLALLHANTLEQAQQHPAPVSDTQ